MDLSFTLFTGYTTKLWPKLFLTCFVSSNHIVFSLQEIIEPILLSSVQLWKHRPKRCLFLSYPTKSWNLVSSHKKECTYDWQPAFNFSFNTFLQDHPCHAYVCECMCTCVGFRHVLESVWRQLHTNSLVLVGFKEWGQTNRHLTQANTT